MISLVTLELPLEEFLEEIVSTIENLQSHHFISITESSFLHNLKENLLQNQIIILLDFAENYSFISQDAAQGFNCNNSQATLHPFIIYYKVSENKLNPINYCIIPDCMQNNANTINAFLTRVLADIKTVLPNLTLRYYFSDRAVSQYKNYKTLSNLCHHFHDHGIHADWHFFATSHGKSPCDGIGGMVKQHVARAGLQNNQILSGAEMFKWCTENITGLKFINISEKNITDHLENVKLEDRYSNSKRFPGMRLHHSFIPRNNEKLEMKHISGDTCFTAVNTTNNEEN